MVGAEDPFAGVGHSAVLGEGVGPAAEPAEADGDLAAADEGVGVVLAEDALGWSPSTKFEDGLKTTISYFRRRIAMNGSPSIFAGASLKVAPRTRKSVGGASRAVVERSD